jgi:hypothetical protein
MKAISSSSRALPATIALILLEATGEEGALTATLPCTAPSYNFDGGYLWYVVFRQTLQDKSEHVISMEAPVQAGPARVHAMPFRNQLKQIKQAHTSYLYLTATVWVGSMHRKQDFAR